MSITDEDFSFAEGKRFSPWSPSPDYAPVLSYIKTLTCNIFLWGFKKPPVYKTPEHGQI